MISFFLLAPASANTPPIPQLADIHLPEKISNWPPAPGWWLLAALAVAMLGSAIWYLLKHYRNNKYRRLALAELADIYKQYQQDQDHSRYLQAANQLLKRVVRAGFPEAHGESLSGQAWLAFLDSTVTQAFMQERCRALISGPYQSKSQLAQTAGQSELDIAALQTSLQLWLRRHRYSSQQAAEKPASQKPEVAA